MDPVVSAPLLVDPEANRLAVEALCACPPSVESVYAGYINRFKEFAARRVALMGTPQARVTQKARDIVVKNYNKTVAKLRGIAAHQARRPETDPIAIVIGEHAGNLACLMGNLEYKGVIARSPAAPKPVPDNLITLAPYDATKDIVLKCSRRKKLTFGAHSDITEYIKSLFDGSVDLIEHRRDSQGFGIWEGTGLRFQAESALGGATVGLNSNAEWFEKFVLEKKGKKKTLTEFGKTYQSLVERTVKRLLMARQASGERYESELAYCWSLGCPHNSGFMVEYFGNDDEPVMCPVGHRHRYCTTCKRYENPAMCSATMGDMDAETIALLQSDSKPCPNCRMLVTKNGGCNHMTCTNCGQHFCWLCSTQFDARIQWEPHALCGFQGNPYGPALERPRQVAPEPVADWNAGAVAVWNDGVEPADPEPAWIHEPGIPPAEVPAFVAIPRGWRDDDWDRVPESDSDDD